MDHGDKTDMVRGNGVCSHRGRLSEYRARQPLFRPRMQTLTRAGDACPLFPAEVGYMSKWQSKLSYSHVTEHSEATNVIFSKAVD